MEALMIPLTKDVAALAGEWAEGVENRSLLHEKFALPKVWGVGDVGKLNDAGRWSVLRIVTRGSELLRSDSQRLRRESGGRNVRPDVAERKERDAHVAEKMATIARVDGALAKVGNDNARRFLADLDKSFKGMVVTFEATLGARMMVNLAGGVVENAGIALDRCFGLPLIPGSAVKGITRVQALWEIREAKGDEKLSLLRLAMLLFGYGVHDLRGDLGWAGGAREAQAIADEIGAQDFKGCACFLPAYPTTPATLVVDMVNPHYPSYYSGRSPRAEDNENPIPNYFPAVETGSTFGFAALLNRVPNLPSTTVAGLLAQVKQWLERAVTRKGVGAKTAAGYGWFELGRKETALPSASASPSAAPTTPAAPASPADQLVARFKNLNTKDNFPAALPQMAALASEADLRRVFETLVPANERNKLRKSNPYWQAFTSGKAGADGQKILVRLGLKLS
jgi:CRISPR type III-B/RAMP module RAMP protein Cmr6